MNTLARGYMVLFGFLAVGAAAAWFVLWHNTCNNCGMATDGTEGYYVMWAICLGVVLGIAGGCMFALLAPRMQFMHALVFSIVAAGIAFGLLGTTRQVMYPLERYDAFLAWTDKHSIVWLANAPSWISYWIADAIYCWLIPQLATQLLAVVAARPMITRYRLREEHPVPDG